MKTMLSLFLAFIIWTVKGQSEYELFQIENPPQGVELFAPGEKMIKSTARLGSKH